MELHISSLNSILVTNKVFHNFLQSQQQTEQIICKYRLQLKYTLDYLRKYYCKNSLGKDIGLDQLTSVVNNTKSVLLWFFFKENSFKILISCQKTEDWCSNLPVRPVSALESSKMEWQIFPPQGPRDSHPTACPYSTDTTRRKHYKLYNPVQGVRLDLLTHTAEMWTFGHCSSSWTWTGTSWR